MRETYCDYHGFPDLCRAFAPRKDNSMGDKARGLYEKFKIERTDGKSQPGQKHHRCRYFVLDLDHDVFGRIAAGAYASACEDEYPLLAADLWKQLKEIERNG